MIKAVLPAMRRSTPAATSSNITSMRRYYQHAALAYYSAASLPLEGSTRHWPKEVKGHLGFSRAAIGARIRTNGPAVQVRSERSSFRYDTVFVPAVRKRRLDNSGQQAATRPKAARPLLLEIAESDEPPTHLLLGRMP